jgi:uncharacterized OB-fold protein
VSAPGPPGAGAAAPLTLGEFFAGVREGRVTVQRCGACGALAIPPRVSCAECHAATWARQPLGGDGEVASFTVIRVPPGRLAAEAPYAVVVVRMAEGVSLLGRLTAPLEAARVGLPVRLVAPAAPAAEPPVVTFAAR